MGYAKTFFPAGGIGTSMGGHFSHIDGVRELAQTDQISESWECRNGIVEPVRERVPTVVPPSPSCDCGNGH